VVETNTVGRGLARKFSAILATWNCPFMEKKELKVERIDETGAFSVSFYLMSLSH
jgi:hypothetical protein